MKKITFAIFLFSMGLSAEWRYEQVPGDKVVYFVHTGKAQYSMLMERAALIAATVPGVKAALIKIHKEEVSIEVSKEFSAKWADFWPELSLKLLLAEECPANLKDCTK